MLRERDPKGLYAGGVNVAGADFDVEFPKSPDVVINNDGSGAVGDIVAEILRHGVVEAARHNDDTGYWNSYYGAGSAPGEPSLFAREMFERYMTRGGSLIEFGCGNGRDSVWFAGRGLTVTAIDASDVAIKRLRGLGIANATFVCDDFTRDIALYQSRFDYCYSRFTLHAIGKREAERLLHNTFEMLAPGGLFFVEARSTSDGKFGEGRQVGPNEFIYDGHYRRFIEKDELAASLARLGFDLVELAESDSFAPRKGEKSVCVRAVAKKAEKSCEKS